MTIPKKPLCPGEAAGTRAFTLVEVMFAMVIVGVLFVALYAGIATSTSWVRTCQENEIATQILSEKLDTIRLYNWNQINSNGFIQTNFTVGIDPTRTNSPAYYTGKVTIVKTPVSETYRGSMVQVNVNVSWVSLNKAQSRDMSTFVAKYGLQSYVMR